METITTKPNTGENITEVVKPVIKEGLMDNFSMPPDERSDATAEEKAKMKESVEEKSIKEKTLKEKIFSMFKSKTVAEMTDPVKLREMAKEDSMDLSHINTHATGLGFTMDMGAKYRDFMKKYNMNNEEGEKMIKEIELCKNKLDKMENGYGKIGQQKEFNELHFNFTNNLHSIVEKRIQDLEQK